MDEETFQALARPDNLANREELYRQATLDELRLALYMFLLSRESDEDDFDLTKYIEKLGDSDYLQPVFESLPNLGWKYTVSFGGTALFVYTGEKPSRCWE